MKKTFFLAVFLAALPALALGMNEIPDNELSDIDGGFRIIVHDFYVDTDDVTAVDHGYLKLGSDFYNDSEISELRIHKAVSAGGGRNVGANIGSSADPMRLEIRNNGIFFFWPNTMDPVDVHFRTDSHREIAPTQLVFDSITDIFGLKLSNTESRLWAVANNGLQFRSKSSMSADSLRLQTVDPILNPSAAQVQAATVQLYGIQMNNMVFGTDTQPVTMTSFVDGSGFKQIRLEIAPLTLANPDAPDGSLSINRANFGNSLIPFTPPAGQNLVSIKGMEIQHMRITTQDLQ